MLSEITCAKLADLKCKGSLYRVLSVIFSFLSVNSPASANLLRVDCDSLFLSNHRVVAVKNLVVTGSEVSFAYCDDTTSTQHSAPWMQVSHIKKADGSVINSPFQKNTVEVQPAANDEMEQKVNSLMVTAIISIPMTIIGIGFIMAVVVLILGSKYKRRIVGHPREQALRRKIRRAMWIAAILPLAMLILSFGVIVWGIWALSNFNDQ